MKRLWNFISYLGIKEADNIHRLQELKIRVFFNRASVIGFFALIVHYASVYPYMQMEAVLYWGISEVLLLLSLYLHKKGLFGTAKRILIYGVYALGFASVLRYGGDFYIHFASIGLMVFSFVVFDAKKEIPDRGLVLMIVIATVLAGELEPFHPRDYSGHPFLPYSKLFALGNLVVMITIFVWFLNDLMGFYDVKVLELVKEQQNYISTISRMNENLERQYTLLQEQEEELRAAHQELLARNEEVASQAEELKVLNEELRNTNDILAEKNKAIVDSLIYTSRLQKAILPPKKLLDEKFRESFVFYQPKDIVAGDFYWIEYSEEQDKLFFAVADATGHGVPGAVVSFLGYNALQRCVREDKLDEAGEILTQARKYIIETFRYGNKEIHDGMDVALCVLEGNTLTFAGAYNSLLLIRNNRLNEYKGDKQPVGYKMGMSKTFSSHQITLQKEDVLYLFSDGFSDQIGGENNKKLKYKTFKSILLRIHKLPMHRQTETLQKFFMQWKKENAQTDDVCIMGVRV